MNREAESQADAFAALLAGAKERQEVSEHQRTVAALAALGVEGTHLALQLIREEEARKAAAAAAELAAEQEAELAAEQEATDLLAWARGDSR